LLKLHLSGQAFIECANKEHGIMMCNTLFGKIDCVANIKFHDMMEYLDLLVAMYQLSPEGCFTAIIKYAKS
jgi:hypothetical protein